MSDDPPPFPYADCPTCHRHHSAALAPGQSITMLCDCGKLLKVQRAEQGSTLVVTEQVQPLVQVAAEPGAPPV